MSDKRMSKKIDDPVVRTCMNCMLLRIEFTFIRSRGGPAVNIIPYNCPVVKDMSDECMSKFTTKRIRELHHEVNFVRR